MFRGGVLALLVALAGGMAGCEMDTPDPDDGGGGPRCTALGNSCGNDGQCCSGLKCQGGICDARVSCQPLFGRCGPGVPCCGTNSCTEVAPNNRICSDGRCAGGGAACGSGIQCCGALVCRSNVCTQ